MSASDFSNTAVGFVAGSVRGLRTFNCNADGVLRSPMFGVTFTEGENKAECLWHLSAFTGRMVERPKDTHQIAGGSCTCGFYAYSEQGMRLQPDRYANTYAVVEGYGHATVGTLGFKCEKLKILAIVHPDTGKMGSKNVSPVTLRLARIGETMHPLRAALGLAIIGIMAGVLRQGALSIACMTVCWLLIVAQFFCVWLRFGNTAARHRLSTSHASFTKMRKQYPETPFFATVEEATAVFPLTPHVEPAIRQEFS